MNKQPVFNGRNEFLWVLPYKKEVLCTCTKVVYHSCIGGYAYATLESEDYFYTNKPSLFVHSNGEKELQALFQCDTLTGRSTNCYLIIFQQIYIKRKSFKVAPVPPVSDKTF